MSDPLDFVNNATSSSDQSAWLALESNPQVFNEFAKKVGLADRFEFVDYYGLGIMKQPALAFLLLFPCSDNLFDQRQKQEDDLQEIPGYSERSKHLCFVKQVQGFGNACGTIACLHVCLNTHGAMDETTPLGSFRRSSNSSTPQERGELLHQLDAFKCVSDTAAVSSDAQTACPDRDGVELDHHFVAFVWDAKSERIFELDGTKFGPIDHGPSSLEDFEEKTWGVIQNNFLQVEPDSLEFSLMALTYKEES
jgi:ubiquitin carboxyl-terminal hydrolase L3